MYENIINKKACQMGIPNFMGTFPKDRIPSPKRLPASFILNLDIMNQPGIHWVAVLMNRDNTVEYYDSLAEKPLSELYVWKKKILYNNKPTQNIFAETCGHHALYYLYLRSVVGFSQVDTLNRIYKCPNPDKYVKRFVDRF